LNQVNRYLLLFVISLTVCLIPSKTFPSKVVLRPLKVSGADSITVYVFLLETCPICQSITLELKSMYAKFQAKGIAFIGIFPNASMSNNASIAEFKKKYTIPFELKIDNKQKLTKQFAATVTPTVVVVRNVNQQILYQGKINDSFEAIGKRRQVITAHYLNSALEHILQNKPANPAETKPVGCFISK